MRTPPQRPRPALAVEPLEARELPSVAPTPVVLAQENFDRTALGALPAAWSQWSSQDGFAVAPRAGTSGSSGLTAAGDGGQTARTWAAASQPADVRASADVLVNSLVPAQVFVRGRNLNTGRPTYYAVSVTRGLDVKLLRNVDGFVRTLGDVKSAGYLSNQWVTVTLRADGTSLQAFVQRRDTGQYLNGKGEWQTGSTAALSVTDSAVTGGGQTGLGRAGGYAGAVSFDNFAVRGATASASATPLLQQNFNTTPGGQLPAGWVQWESEGDFAVSSQGALSKPSSLEGNTAAGHPARAWLNAPAPADVQVGAAVYLNNLAPAEVLSRGSQLDTASPSYYALAVSRGLRVQLLRVSGGKTTVLGTRDSKNYLSGQWVQVTLRATGSSLQAQVQRLDTRQYLTGNGTWQASPTAALTVTDKALAGAGQVGLAKGPDYAGAVQFDNFTVSGLGAAPSGGHSSGTGNDPAPSPPPGAGVPGAGGARHTGGGHGAQIPQHYPWIRLAELAYSGTPLGPFEQSLLRNSIDLVIPNTDLLPNLNAVAPHTPSLIYTNVSTLYRELLTDWLNWADAHHVSRESAFYHVAVPSRFSGRSSSSVPVNWFWGVYLGGDDASYTDVTYAAHDPSARAVQFGDTGTSVYLGYTDKFREINFNLASGARAGWSAVLEYATAVNAQGVPTAWAPLKTLTDTSHGLARSGQVTFDPPTNWTTASINGSARLFYVRVRTVSGGTAPLADTILGRNYTNSHDGGWSGTIPVFDYAADKNHDGYLNDAEYAVAVRHGDYARFAYESRLFLASYGPQRVATNPSSPAFKAWAIDYDQRLLASQPLAGGLFVDNSSGGLAAAAASVLEPVSTYSRNYGAVLSAVGRAIAPRFLLANTSGGQTVADGVISQNTGYFEESALRPMASDWQQFEDLAALIAHRASLRAPAPYAVLDSLATGGSPTDPRTQIATLAEYYLLADPKTTFLDFYGGQEPATSWSRHFSRAVTYNVGQPVGGWSLFAAGRDPSDVNLVYHVYERRYTNALVLYKPTSHTQGFRFDGKSGSSSATVFNLDRTYRPLRADGTLGSPVTRISLRNEEGAVLIPVSGGD